MDRLFTWRFGIHGRVQGVGFRPYTRKLAQEHGVFGQVKNNNNGLTIKIDANEQAAMHFFDSLKRHAPERSFITDIQVDQSPATGYTSFDIVESTTDNIGQIFLSPDHAICSICRSDIRNPKDRRFQYGFTTCLNCGPRYSIQSDIPYDRIHTSMKAISMCSSCKTEYNQADNRRAHSQTNSCPNCKISIHLFDNGKELIGNEPELIDKLIEVLQSDGILAIKGLSGYLLCCKATSEKAIEDLRYMKHRPSKPFAVMYSSMEIIQSDYIFSVIEKNMIDSSIAPIVLLKPETQNLPDLIAPGLSRIGVFLPSTPLLQVILDRCAFPIIATSGNVTNEPLQYKDADAINKLKGIADVILTYNREIIIPQDDSVVLFSPRNQQKIIIRRARGMAPEYIATQAIPDQCIYAFGADMKNTLTIQSRNNIYISQYLGDGSNYDTQNRIYQIRNHFTTLLKEEAEVVLADAHPGYQTRNLAEEYAVEVGAKIYFVQHHKAHFSAILEEQGLWSTGKKILGVIWDGTGYSEDGNSWGGEFLQWDGKDLERIGHLTYTPIIAGDKMAKEPRLSALSFGNGIDGIDTVLKDKFTNTEWHTYNQLLKSAKVNTSSIGRLFDAVASLLGVCDINQYEGQAAMLLEDLAHQHKPTSLEISYPIHNDLTIDHRLIIKGILVDLKANKDRALIAYQFHLTLVQIIGLIATTNFIKDICCSGGVFQNGLLTDLIIDTFKEPYNLYFHEHLSPNDENISFGQLAYYNRIIKVRDE